MTILRFAASVALSLLVTTHVAHAQPTAPGPATTPVAQPSSAPQPEQVTPTPSDSDTHAKELYVQGDRAYAEGKYSLALVLFRESYALSNRELILIAMANSQERLGDLEGALANLRTYAEKVDISKEPNIEQRILALETRINAVAEKAEQERLAREQAQVTAPVASPSPAPALILESEDAKPTRKWPWILVGTGSAAVVAGVTFALVARSARGKADGLCSNKAQGDVLCLPGAQKYLDRDSTFSVLADISVTAGAAAIATGVVFLLRPTDDEASRGGPSVAVGKSSLAVTFEGSF